METFKLSYVRFDDPVIHSTFHAVKRYMTRNHAKLTQKEIFCIKKYSKLTRTYITRHTEINISQYSNSRSIWITEKLKQNFISYESKKKKKENYFNLIVKVLNKFRDAFRIRLTKKN